MTTTLAKISYGSGVLDHDSDTWPAAGFALLDELHAASGRVALIAAARLADADDLVDRFRSADEFMAALLALGVEEANLPTPAPDAMQRMRVIEEAVISHDFDRALGACPQNWVAVRERILRRRDAIEATTRLLPLLEVDGFSLTYIEQRDFSLASSPSNEEVGPGTVDLFLVKGPHGELLEVLDYRTHDGPRWLAAGDVFQTPKPLRRLGQGLRMTVTETDTRCWVQLNQARVDPNDWSNTYKATVDELNSGSGVDVVDVLKRFGARDVGTQADVLGDQGRRRNYLCATFAAGNGRRPAVAYFLTRVMPLAKRYPAGSAAHRR